MKVKRILVSQPKPSTEKSPYYDVAAKHGVELVFRPFIRIEGLTGKEFRQQKINIADYTAVVFTSLKAVDHYFRLCEETRVKVPDTMKYFCTTETVAHYLQKYIVYRKRKIAFGKSGKLDDAQLVQAIEKNKKERYLIPISDVNKDEMEVLTDMGVDFTKAVMYRTVSNDFQPDESLDYGALLFFSPSGIDSLKKNFPDFDQKASGIAIGCFGATTQQAAKDAGLTVDIPAPTPESPSMIAALDRYLDQKK